MPTSVSFAHHLDGLALAAARLHAYGDAAGLDTVVPTAHDWTVRDLVAQESGQAWLGREEALERFRPSIVVDGEEPFAEDSWRRVRIGGTTYRFGEHCDRCVLTTIDPTSLETGREPIRTLARHRAWDGATWFGIRLIPELAPGATAEVAVGDEVEVLETAPDPV